LSQNRLNFTYYAFSDEGIDYSGSLATTNFTGSIDNLVLRNMSFEEHQRLDAEFSSHLYTISPKSKKIPEFITFPITGSDITLKRRYQDTKFKGQNYEKEVPQKPIAAIMKATLPTANRKEEHVIEQSLSAFLRGINK
jgi:hypothetical protein